MGRPPGIVILDYACGDRPGDLGGTLIFTRMLSQGNSCEFGHYEYAHSFVRSLRIYSRAVHFVCRW